MIDIQRPSKLPFLEFLGWQIADVYRLTPLEMLASYERGWRYRHIANPSHSELSFIKQLVLTHQSWLSNEFMNFQVGHHQLIYRVLENFNHEFLSNCRAYFGGGTLLAFSDFRLRCYENLAIAACFRARLINSIDLLAMDLDLTKTQRTISEAGMETHRVNNN
jgi:hypothetical protein